MKNIDRIATTYWVIAKSGPGEQARACRVVTGATAVVIVEYMHPNYGYFADAVVFVRFAHSDTFIAVSSRSGWETKEQILEWFPQFKPLFELKEEEINPLLQAVGRIKDAHL